MTSRVLLGGLIVCCALLVRGGEHRPKGAYLDNGTVRLGVDLSAGGSIFYFAESATKRNLLNHRDLGRFIQQSYYGKEDGSTWAKKPWRWNPVQGGGYRGKQAKLLEKKIEKDSLYIRSMPKHWATGADVPDATMEEWIELVGPVGHIRFKFTYSGKEQNHPNRHQELPAVFVDYALPNLVFYKGNKPWTNGALTRVVPGWPNQGQHTDECWAAYVDEKDWGIGVFFPGTKEMTTYRHKGREDPGPKGTACSYFAPVRSMKITPGFSFEYDVYVTIGKVDEIRKRFQKIHEKKAVAH
jgi:hypothetical protein